MNNKSSEISEFIDDNKLDICAITENWLTTGDEQITTGNLTPEGYKLHHVPRDKGRGGGVAILCKLSFVCKKVKTSRAHTYESMEVHVKSRADCFRVIILYHPPACSSIEDFVEEFTEYMDSHATTSGFGLL